METLRKGEKYQVYNKGVDSKNTDEGKKKDLGKIDQGDWN